MASTIMYFEWKAHTVYLMEHYADNNLIERCFMGKVLIIKNNDKNSEIYKFAKESYSKKEKGIWIGYT